MPTTQPANVTFGIDTLIQGPAPFTKQAKLGLVTNDAAVTAADAKTTTRVALKDAGFSLVRLFAPEHGIAASARDGARITDMKDTVTGVPVISLYGGGKVRPERDELADLDAVLFDIPDVGSRFYTYIWTLSHVLEACADAKKPLYVLDRPNPIGGDLAAAEGPILDEANINTFVGRWNIPTRHSLTLGELAALWNAERNIGAEVQTFRTEGWTRDMHWPATGLPFVPPSPNMRTYEAALAYPGTCLFEGTNLSEGRGTDEPLRQAGAPWAKGEDVAEQFNAAGVPGWRAKAVTFTPEARKFKGEQCSGVLLEPVDPPAARPVAAGLHLVAIFRRLYPEQFAFTPPGKSGYGHFDRLIGRLDVRETLDGSPEDVAKKVAQWTQPGNWAQRVHPHLQYD